jgi:DNA ligase-1
MRAFADLYTALDETTKTNEKLAALTDYFTHASPADAAWVVYFLSGRKPKQVVPTRKLASWAIEEAGIPDWLFSESYDAVGDLAETITLLLPNDDADDDTPLHTWIEERLLPLRGKPEDEQRAVVVRAWTALDRPQRFVWNKLITGAFRVGVSQRLITRALSAASGVDDQIIAHRLMGNWEPTPQFYENLIDKDHAGAEVGRPYPFFLAYAVEDRLGTLGELDEWQAEWKWDGIRAQMIHREGQVFIWSRGEELITEGFPELAEAAARLPEGTVLDGEILPWIDGVQPFAQLQRRISRKKLTKKIMAEVPVIFLTYDLLEIDGQDIREQPLDARRAQLLPLLEAITDPHLLPSPVVDAETWEALETARADSRDRNVEGIMLKRRSSPYRVGRVRGDWWKWKVEPYTIDAVLINAQRGSGKRASLYTDYTFGVWDGDKLVPFAKAYSGLTDAEIRQVDSFVRRNTQEKFGPVRSVKPELVFELAFEGIQRSSRHKSGVAVRFPRILRWRHDKPITEADSLEMIQAMLPPE